MISWGFTVCVIFVVVNLSSGIPAPWDGQWFPHNPNEPDTNPSVTLSPSLHDSKHGVIMGVKNKQCDDGETNLPTDWFNNPENYTCLDDKQLYLPNSNIRPVLSSDPIPKGYSAPHKCMNEAIEYNNAIPTFGPHRPLWAQYGEYKFLPKQRWIHNLEHGSVVMLYHPCANKLEVDLLRSLVISCLYRHVITPYDQLSPARPMALVTWGYRLEMSKVAPEIVIDFIKKHALHGPEQISRDGQYTHMLTQHAKVLEESDVNDVVLCPNTLNANYNMK